MKKQPPLFEALAKMQDHFSEPLENRIEALEKKIAETERQISEQQKSRPAH